LGGVCDCYEDRICIHRVGSIGCVVGQLTGYVRELTLGGIAPIINDTPMLLGETCDSPSKIIHSTYC